VEDPWELFVGVLGASDYTYAEALPSQQLPQWIAAHVHCFQFLGGCPKILVPDYVPRHIIDLLCPVGLCGRGPA
jgi:transposase